MKKHLIAIKLLTLGLIIGTLTACPGPNNFGGDIEYSEEPKAGISNAPLASLITGSVISEQEALLRDNLTRQIDVKFPIRVGVIYYNYRTELKEVDQLEVFKHAEESFKASGLVRETVQIPSALLGSNASVDQVRQLAARFQTEVIVIVTGENTFGRANSQALSFFDSFTNKAYYDAQSQLEALALDVFTGTFLPPFSSSVKEEAQLLDPSLPEFSQTVYQLKKTTETQAWEALEKRFVESLEALKAEIAARPKPSPQPTPIPSPSATNEPDTNEGE